MSYLPYAVCGWILLVGLYGIVTSRNLVHLAVCLTVTQSSTYLLLVCVGYVHGGGAPIFGATKPGSSEPSPLNKTNAWAETASVIATIDVISFLIFVLLKKPSDRLPSTIPCPASAEPCP